MKKGTQSATLMDIHMTKTVYEVWKEAHGVIVYHCAIFFIIPVNRAPWSGAVGNLHSYQCILESQERYRTVRAGWAGYGPAWDQESTLRPTKLEERR